MPRTPPPVWPKGTRPANSGRSVGAWSARLRLHPSSVLIREPKKRWGSADAKGNIRFNWRIIQTPTRLIDYVVAHELVHLAHPDHARLLVHARPDDARL